MCGIVGILSQHPHGLRTHSIPILKRLEYRGYDSVGVVTREGDAQKAVGPIAPFLATMEDLRTKTSIAHTRWATHGGVSETNAHPHCDATGEFWVVHNGIIENTDALRATMPEETTVSETDTEVIACFFHDRIARRGLAPDEAIREFFRVAHGTYAVLLLRRNSDELWALKHNSPLALARAPELLGGTTILASDISAFSREARAAVFFEDHTYCQIRPDGCAFFDEDGAPFEPTVQAFEWVEETALDHHAHYMIKEILEQPVTSRRLLESFKTTQRPALERFAGHLKKARRVVFISCGTSYHASLVGTFLLNRLGYEAHTVIASEFENFLLVDPSTFLIPISQSGETMDVILPLKRVRGEVGRVGSIVNVPYSTIQRMSDVTLDLQAGHEVCVASTKAFTNQVITLMKLAELLGAEEDLDAIPAKIRTTLETIDAPCRELARQLRETRDLYVLGRGVAYPMAREIALKFKEIDYIHAEGMMAGELKHGTLALIEDGTPVICLVPGNDPAMVSSTREVQARGARTIVVSNTGNGDINLPTSTTAEFSIYACLFGHLLSYYIGVDRGLPIDQPRNLAKSVTVG